MELARWKARHLSRFLALEHRNKEVIVRHPVEFAAVTVIGLTLWAVIAWAVYDLVRAVWVWQVNEESEEITPAWVSALIGFVIDFAVLLEIGRRLGWMR